MSRLSSRQSWLLIAVVAIAFSTGLSLALRQNEVSGEDRAPALTSHQYKLEATVPAKSPDELKQSSVVEQANSLSRAFRASAQSAMPSVVTIHSHQSVKKVSGIRNERNPLKDNPMLRQFEDMLPKGFQMPEGMEDFNWQTPQREGVGSGVIIDRSGIVITNNHVVEGADTVTVHLADGREFKATDIKTDPHTDLAVVRIAADGDLPVAHLGNSDELEIGDWVIAIGTPFAQDKTVTAGIISGKGRQVGLVRRTEFLQTDAAINPGNSGGPLVNLTGEVVGINTAIASNSGGYQGVGFAIPINQAKWIANQLIKNGAVNRGFLGVQIGEVTGELAAKFGVAKNSGALVAEVFPNTPAAEAKLQDGDIIQKFAGKEVHNPRELQDTVERTPLGAEQPVEVLRDGKRLTLNVNVKSMPSEFGLGERSPTGPTFKKAPPAEIYEAEELGLEVGDLTAEEAQTFKGFEGVVVRKVDPESAAFQKGLRADILIRKVGKTPVRNVQEFEAAMKNESIKNGVLLQIRTTNGNRFVVLQAP